MRKVLLNLEVPQQLSTQQLFESNTSKMSTTTVVSQNVALPTPKEKALETEMLLQKAESLHTKPLWAQMSRLNPPLPNPKCSVHVWNYDEIRPHLVRAGELITEKQAERRVLMLVNPARGTVFSFSKPEVPTDPFHRSSLHDRHDICRLAAGHAK